jgi:sterol desaturase/sphingolipid hydroxylase (fatty acid hydroxylase superfamily)
MVPRPSKKLLLIVACVAALALFGLILQDAALKHKLVLAIYNRGLNVFYFPVLDLFRNSFFTLSFWVVILITLFLQRVIPADRNQKIFSIGFGQDLVWFFYEAILHAAITVTYVHLLIRLYGKFFSALTVNSLMGLPGGVRFLIVLLLVDFLHWAQHLCHHKVPVLWQFHALHHSQKELNFFTDFRYHVLEYVVRQTFHVIPFLILHVEAPVIVSFAVFHRWYSRFYHGNIRTNLGLLRYILVTPQSHRVHHSIESEHRDTNYGSIFSVWDWIFGTQHKNSDVYPQTGIDDLAFPHEQSGRLRSLLVTPVRQMFYPFLVIGRQQRVEENDKARGSNVGWGGATISLNETRTGES